MAFDLSSLTNIFTGAPAKDAAASQRSYLDQQQAAITNAINSARTGGVDALRAGTTGAVGALAPAIGQARTDISGATPQALNMLQSGQTAGANALTAGQTGGLDALQSGVNAATGAYAPLSAAANRYGADATGASNMTAAALGLMGPEGAAAARGAFQAGPGFQFGLDKGLEALLRNANAGGGPAGGNILRESQAYGQGLQNQEWDKWLANLSQRQQLYAPLEASAHGTAAGGTANAALTGGTGAANIYTGTGGRLSDLFSGTGRAGADIYGAEGRSLADLASRGGLATADILRGGGQSEANLLAQLAGQQVGGIGALTGPYTDTYKQESAGALGGSQNLWNLIGGGAKLAAGSGWLPVGPNAGTPWKNPDATPAYGGFF